MTQNTQMALISTTPSTSNWILTSDNLYLDLNTELYFCCKNRCVRYDAYNLGETRVPVCKRSAGCSLVRCKCVCKYIRTGVAQLADHSDFVDAQLARTIRNRELRQRDKELEKTKKKLQRMENRLQKQVDKCRTIRSKSRKEQSFRKATAQVADVVEDLWWDDEFAPKGEFDSPLMFNMSETVITIPPTPSFVERTGDDSMAYDPIYKRYYRTAQAQGLSDAATAVVDSLTPTAVKSTLNAGTDTLTAATEAIHVVTETTQDARSLMHAANEKMNSIVETIHGFLKGITDSIFPKDVNLLDLALLLANSYYALKDGHWILLSLQAVKLCMMLGIDYGMIQQTIAKFQDLSLVQDTMSYFRTAHAQSLDLDAALPFITSLIGIVLTLLGGTTLNYKTYIEAFSAFGRASTGWRNAMNMITYIFEWIQNVYYMYGKGKTLKQVEFERKMPKHAQLFAASELIREIPLCYFDKSQKLCKHVLSVFKEWDLIRFDAIRSGDRDIADLCRNARYSLVKAYDAALSSPAMQVNARAKPSAFYFYGTPGTGKTLMTQMVDYKLYAKYCKGKNHNLADFVFSRKAENEYFDGYRNQPIVHYDDMLQRPDSKQTPNEEYMEIVRAINEDNWQLHMSAIEDKKSTFYDSPFLIATSNTELPPCASLADPNAFYRRFAFFCDIRVKKEFQNNMGGYDQTLVEAEAIKLGIDPVLTTFQYEIDVYKLKMDLKTRAIEKTVTHPSIGFTEFWDLMCEYIDANQAKTNKLKSALLKLANVDIETRSDKITQWEEKLDLISETVADDIAGILDSIDNKEIAEAEAKPTESLFSKLASAGIEVTTQWMDKAKAYTTKMKSLLADFVTKGKDFCGKILSTGQQFVRWLVEKVKPFMTSHLAMNLIAGFVAAGSVSILFDTMFRKNKCKKAEMNTMDDYLNTRPCNKCHVCKTYFSSWNDDCFGQLEYHGNQCWQMMKDSSEIVRNRAVALGYQFFSRAMNPESAEIATQRRQRTYRAESNVIQTARPYRQVVAESAEITSQRQPRKFLSEAKLLESTLGMTNLTTNILYNNAKAEVRDVVLNEQHLKVSYSNTVRVRYNTWTGYCEMNGFFLKGTLLCVPYHFLYKRDQSTYLEVINVLGNRNEPQQVNWNDVKIHQCARLNGEKIDLAILELPRLFVSRPDITKYLVATKDAELISEGDVVVASYRSVKDTTVLSLFSTNKVRVAPPTRYVVGETTYLMNTGLDYEVGTEAGDCGSLVYVRNKLIASKIVGMHVCGYDGNGVALILTRELLENNLRMMNPREISSIDGRIPYEAEGAEVRRIFPGNSLAMLGDCLSLGITEAPHCAGKTAIVKSALHGLIDKPIMKPAYLRPIEIDGQLIDPMVKGLQKVLGTQSQIETKLLNVATNDVEQTIINFSPSECQRVLTYEEAVAGIPGLFKGLNRRTSPGYPYSLKNPAAGKHYWFGKEGEYIINEEIRVDVEAILENARNGKRSDVIFVASLKDERRMIEKVEAGKTRVFEAAPQHFVIAVRMYFLAFCQALAEGRIKNEVAVGTNVYSRDWDQIGKAMLTKGKHVIAGDFSNFDGSLNQLVLWKILDIINAWYDGTEEESRIRMMLFEEIVNANVLHPKGGIGEVFRQTHSQPSGNPLTVVINSIFNQIVMRIAYLDCKRTAGLDLVCDFRDNVSFITYGDDNLLNISDSAIEWYNQETITESLAKFGLTYTDEGKTGTMVKSRTIDDVAFLKRKFVQDEAGTFLAPLDLAVVKEMVNWVKGKAVKAATIQNIETSLIELALHGENIYNEQVAKLRTVCRNKGLNTAFPSFEELDDTHRRSRYGICEYTQEWDIQ